MYEHKDGTIPEFQSTLPRRERRGGVQIFIGGNDFNPRSHEGSDWRLVIYVSLLMDFNPRSHEGSDGAEFPKVSSSPKFQSTLPRRERHYEATKKELAYIFQSTLPRRERLSMRSSEITASWYISIHAPTKGATFVLINHFPNTFNFNPRSHEGSDTWVLHTTKRLP